MTPTPQRRRTDTLVPIARRNGMEAAAQAYDAAGFEPEDYAYTAKLLRDYCNHNRASFHAVCSNNLNIILAALDIVAATLQRDLTP